MFSHPETIQKMISIITTEVKIFDFFSRKWIFWILVSWKGTDLKKIGFVVKTLSQSLFHGKREGERKEGVCQLLQRPAEVRFLISYTFTKSTSPLEIITPHRNSTNSSNKSKTSLTSRSQHPAYIAFLLGTWKADNEAHNQSALQYRHIVTAWQHDLSMISAWQLGTLKSK